jgi:hypothetical protein
MQTHACSGQRSTGGKRWCETNTLYDHFCDLRMRLKKTQRSTGEGVV